MWKASPGKRPNYVAVGLCLGVAFGAAIGVALGNLAYGMGLGIALGVAQGVALQKRANRAPAGEDTDNSADGA